MPQVKPEDLDHLPLNRGKFRGRTPSEVAEIEPSYITVVLASWNPKVCSDALIRDCQRDLDASDRGRHQD